MNLKMFIKCDANLSLLPKETEFFAIPYSFNGMEWLELMCQVQLRRTEPSFQQLPDCPVHIKLVSGLCRSEMLTFHATWKDQHFIYVDIPLYTYTCPRGSPLSLSLSLCLLSPDTEPFHETLNANTQFMPSSLISLSTLHPELWLIILFKDWSFT